MSWIVVDDSAKGSIGSSTATLRGTHRASSMRSRSSTATASTASAMHIGSAAQKQQQRRRASSNTRNGASGNGSRHVDASKRLLGSGGRKVSRRKHTHAVQASNEASHADDAPQQQYLGVKTEEMELLQHALDGAWGKFGEARVLTQQRCFQDAWKALMEAKQLIDRAAGSSCCITRHYQALVQLGHELNAATQSWLLREQPGQEQAPTKPAMAYSSLASETTRAPPQHQQHPMGSTGGVEEAEAEEELRLEQNDDTIAHQHPVEASVSMKIRGKNTNIYLGCDNCEDDGVAVTCRVTPSKASRFAPSRLRDVWNLVSPKSPPRLYDAYGKPAAKFSDGIVTPVNGANGRGVLRSSSFSLFHPSVPTEAMYVLRRQKQEQTETEKEEESHPQQRSQQRNPSPLSPRPLPSPLQQQQ
ncbi:hypothetical protein DQ04_15551000, partial [Trypanosoma grayi]|uniref:hypothetical protein n=1 Tax=Trypanosoma grayi TaxID=71804 RepID=UPI0004F415C2